jgi:sigma-B regulation protein RsbU (phosphoserine phosphatase)
MDRAQSSGSRVLIADDQTHIQDALRLLLRQNGFRPDTASSPDAVIRALAAEAFDLLLMDLNYRRDTTSGSEGLELIERVRTLDDSLPIVVMTGWATMDLAIDAMRIGVRDFVQKPWENARLLATIRREVDAGRERRAHIRQRMRDLAGAQHVQRGLLPPDVSHVPGWNIAAAWRPAEGIGGDYFDVIKFGDERVAVAIGDVMGKGTPAALLMSNLQAVVRAAASETTPPADVCAAVNHAMCGKMDEGRFITFFYCVLDSADRAIAWSNAGHNPPLLVDASGAIRRLGDGGPVLGLFDDAAYKQGTGALHSADRLVLFTDGISEVRDGGGEEFGEDRLASLAAAQSSLPSEQLHARIFGEVSSFCRGEFQDDATLIVVSGEFKGRRA